MPTATANGISIHYEDHGSTADPAILLIMGVGAQMTLWPIELVEALVGHGFRVIRYDNRDIGLSHKFHGVKAPGIVKLTLLPKRGIGRDLGNGHAVIDNVNFRGRPVATWISIYGEDAKPAVEAAMTTPPVTGIR